MTANALYGMIPLGSGEVVGSMAEGFIIDKLGNRKATIINLCLILITTMIVCWNIWHL